MAGNHRIPAKPVIGGWNKRLDQKANLSHSLVVNQAALYRCVRRK